MRRATPERGSFLRFLARLHIPVELDNAWGFTYHRNWRRTLFGGGFIEIGFLLFIAYLLFGPKKVPEIARTLGKGLGELRRASNELKNSLEEEIKNLDRQAESGPEATSTYGHYDPEPTPRDTEPRT